MTDSTIYESPDGGLTIYARKTGSTERILIQSDPSTHWKAKWYEWEDILKISEQHPALKDAIEKAEMIYQLIKDNK